MAKRSSGGLSGLSTTAIHAELRRRERKVGTLLRRRDRAAANLARLDNQIRMMGGRPGAGGGGRVRNEVGLVESLRKVLQGKEMSVKDMTQKVQDAGYKTNAENFRTIVNQALVKNRKIFKNITRGVYTAI